MGKLYAFKTFLLVCMFTLVVPLGAFAEEFDGDVVEPYGAGEWDYLGEENRAVINAKTFTTDNYYATDGGNFKIDVTSSIATSNVLTVTIFINDQQGTTKMRAYNGSTSLEFSSLPKGAKVWFLITADKMDNFNLKFYD